jgi:hypothetical protein
MDQAALVVRSIFDRRSISAMARTLRHGPRRKRLFEKVYAAFVARRAEDKLVEEIEQRLAGRGLSTILAISAFPVSRAVLPQCINRLALRVTSMSSGNVYVHYGSPASRSCFTFVVPAQATFEHEGAFSSAPAFVAFEQMDGFITVMEKRS